MTAESYFAEDHMQLYSEEGNWLAYTRTQIDLGNNTLNT